MLTLAVLQPDPRATARLADALGSEYELRSLRTWARLWSAAPTAPWSGCIIDIYPPTGAVPPSKLGRLRRRRPDLAIIVYSDFTDRELDLFEVGRQQIDAVILAGFEDTAKAIQATVSRSLASAAAGAVETALEGHLAALGVAVVRWSMEHSFERPGVDELAQSMGMSRSRLARELSRNGLPSPRALLLWSRLFQAARLLQGDTTVEGVAHAVGYSTSSALRRAFQQYVGCPPGTISTRGGVARVLQSFIKAQRVQSA